MVLRLGFCFVFGQYYSKLLPPRRRATYTRAYPTYRHRRRIFMSQKIEQAVQEAATICHRHLQVEL